MSIENKIELSNRENSRNLSYPESEAQIIGGLICRQELLEKYIRFISVTDFTEPAYQDVFRAIQKSYKKSRQADTAMIINECTSKESKQAAVYCVQSFIVADAFREHLNYIKTATENRRIRS